MTGPLPDVTAGQHRLDTGGQTASEPVVIAHSVTTLLYAAATAGWLTVPDRTIDIIGTIVAVLLSTIGVFAARAKVSPTGRITWDGVRGTIRAMVFEELDRLAAAAPAFAYATDPPLPPPPVPSTAIPATAVVPPNDPPPTPSTSTTALPIVPR